MHLMHEVAEPRRRRSSSQMTQVDSNKPWWGCNQESTVVEDEGIRYCHSAHNFFTRRNIWICDRPQSDDFIVASCEEFNGIFAGPFCREAANGPLVRIGTRPGVQSVWPVIQIHKSEGSTLLKISVWECLRYRNKEDIPYPCGLTITGKGLYYNQCRQRHLSSRRPQHGDYPSYFPMKELKHGIWTEWELDESSRHWLLTFAVDQRNGYLHA